MRNAYQVVVRLPYRTFKTYAELRDFFEKERPAWLQTLMPRRINAPSVYWPQKVLAVATVHAAMDNQVASDVGRQSDPLPYCSVLARTLRRHPKSLL